MQEIQPSQPDQAPELQRIERSYATYIDYNSQRLSPTPPEQKTVPNSTTQYYQIPLIYNFGTSTERVLNDFLIEGCEMTTDTGIGVKEGDKKTDYSIMVRFDQNDQKQVQFVETLDEIYRACTYVLNHYKGAVKMQLFSLQAPTVLFKPIVYRAIDENGQPVQGRTPSIFFKLFQRGKAPFIEQTLFTNVDGSEVSWEALKHSRFSFRPLIHIKRIYIGAKISVQLEIKSAVLTSPPAPRGTTSMQTATMEEYATSRPELADMIKSQVSKITQDRQDQMKEKPASSTNSAQAETNTPTFAGIGRNQTQQPSPNMDNFVATPQNRFPNPGIPSFPTTGAIGVPNLNLH